MSLKKFLGCSTNAEFGFLLVVCVLVGFLTAYFVSAFSTPDFSTTSIKSEVQFMEVKIVDDFSF